MLSFRSVALHSAVLAAGGGVWLGDGGSGRTLAVPPTLGGVEPGAVDSAVDPEVGMGGLAIPVGWVVHAASKSRPLAARIRVSGMFMAFASSMSSSGCPL
jgi:hypothetical protein